MNSHERFAAVLQHEDADRFPIDYQAHRQMDTRLKEHLGVDIEEELLDYLGCDFYYLPGRDISQNEGFRPYYHGKKLDYTDTERTCPFGIRWLRGAYDAKFSVDEAIKGPLENVESEKDILNHDWPEPEVFDFSPLIGECEEHKYRVIIGGLWTGIMGDAYRLYGFENFLTDIALKPQLIKTLVNKLTDVYLELNEAVFSQLKGKMDIWFFGNDFGSQDGLLLHPDMWHEFYYDNIKKLVALAKSYNLKVMMHSCGGIAEIIPSLIKAGIDILDPIQITARGMEPEILSKKFGGKIVFHGGIDTQQVLPKSSPEEVKQHAGNIARALGSNGGYIFAPSQLLGPDIPLENIIAMYEMGKAGGYNSNES